MAGGTIGILYLGQPLKRGTRLYDGMMYFTPRGTVIYGPGFFLHKGNQSSGAIANLDSAVQGIYQPTQHGTKRMWLLRTLLRASIISCLPVGMRRNRFDAVGAVGLSVFRQEDSDGCNFLCVLWKLPGLEAPREC